MSSIWWRRSGPHLFHYSVGKFIAKSPQFARVEEGLYRNDKESSEGGTGACII